MREARALRRQCGRSRWPTLWPWRCTLGSTLRTREQLCVLCHPHGYSRWSPSCPWRCTQGSPPSAREQGRDGHQLWRFSPAKVQSLPVQIWKSGLGPGSSRGRDTPRALIWTGDSGITKFRLQTRGGATEGWEEDW